MVAWNEPKEEPTPTQKLWAVDPSAAHEQAFEGLRSALVNGDEDAAAKAQARIEQIEAEQARVHAEARRYWIEKTRADLERASQRNHSSTFETDVP